ncbi:Na+-driven multidrug efflux pump [Actinokineospora baliensis]|uniref:MATE family efflux transporter n=1 Tax=Actinokineospora baliensis TaxID=547056 RepID=UPI00195681B7|nr:MATE family efflux transporter [Actinokineospora baliensis]MBM7771678.1 Na+-driven multidrug efflux pump [Actinokineospora baliensis]
MNALRGPAAHTELTRRNYSSFAFVVLVTSSVGVGYGAIDLAMIAPFGVRYVAAVGLADLIVIGITSYAGGLVAVFASRLAIAEGEGTTPRRLPVLAGSFLLCALVFEAVAVGLSLAMGWLLRVANQPVELIPLAVDYATVGLAGMVVTVVWAATNEALRICGMKNISFVVLACGFVANAALDYVALYTPVASLFASPAQAVAVVSVVVYTAIAITGIVVFARLMRARTNLAPRADRAEVVTEFRSMVWVSQGVGVRNLNDYMGAILPFIFIGTLGPQAVAASVVGAKIYTLFCRLPQACVAGTSVFYGYQVGRGSSAPQLKAHGRTLLLYTAVPTAIGTVLVLACSPWLVRLFGGGPEIDTGAAVMMLVAFMVTIPLYVLEYTYTAVLTVHQRGALMSTISTTATYLFTIPLAWFAVFVLGSAFWAIALGGIVASTVIVVCYARTLYRDHWGQPVPASAEAAGA